MALVDLPGFVADLKNHFVEHGFHVHDERHFVETYSMRQTWEVDCHPEAACEGPLDLFVAIELDPRSIFSFEDSVITATEGQEPSDEYFVSCTFSWALPPLPNGPDLLVLAADLAGQGGTQFPIEVSATDSYPSPTDAPERSLRIMSRHQISLVHILEGNAIPCETIETVMGVSKFLLDAATEWLK